MILITEPFMKQMQSDAEQQYPRECCGILLGKREESTGCRVVQYIYPVHNAAEETMQGRRFEMSPESVLRAEQFGMQHRMELIGVYHSHPDAEARASGEDRQYAMPGCSYPILSVRDGRVVEIKSWELWRGNSGEDFRCEDIQYQKGENQGLWQ